MTIGNEQQLERLKHVGRVVAATLKTMIAAVEPGMTTQELDTLGHELLSGAGARSAPESRYKFPGRPASRWHRQLPMASRVIR